MDLKSFDIDKDYKPNFEYAESKKKRIMNAIQKAKGQEVYIASDPDREGYAIGYMFFEKIKNVASKIYRAEFHEITPSGIKQGLENAKLFVDTNFNYYQSFLARRVSDQLIGFLLSPAMLILLSSLIADLNVLIPLPSKLLRLEIKFLSLFAAAMELETASMLRLETVME